MYKMFLSLAVLLLSVNIMALADDVEQTITLKDGSQIKGVLSGIENGVYTVKTPIIGDVHVAAGDVSSITNGGAAAPAAAASPALTNQAPGSTPDINQRMAATQKQLMSDPQNMAILQQMAQDPEIMQALQDPALIQAVTTHDFQAVQNNPAVQKLMQNPQMMALIQKLAAQQQQQQQN